MDTRRWRNHGLCVNRNAVKQNKKLEQRVKELEDLVNILIHTVADLCEDMMEGE